jgi:hypothetical protein
VEAKAWQALSATLFVERNEFGLNALLGLKLVELGLGAVGVEAWFKRRP